MAANRSALGGDASLSRRADRSGQMRRHIRSSEAHAAGRARISWMREPSAAPSPAVSAAQIPRGATMGLGVALPRWAPRSRRVETLHTGGTWSRTAEGRRNLASALKRPATKTAQRHSGSRIRCLRVRQDRFARRALLTHRGYDAIPPHDDTGDEHSPSGSSPTRPERLERLAPPRPKCSRASQSGDDVAADDRRGSHQVLRSRRRSWRRFGIPR